MRRIVFAFAAAGLALPGSAAAQEIWTGFDFSFTKPNNVDWTLEENQDRITDAVHLTRANTQGLFNIAVESFYTSSSPADTLWATELTSPGQTISANNWENLTYTDWATAYGGAGSLAFNITQMPAVVRLISDDIYLDLQFTSWSVGFEGGGFAYNRAVPFVGPKNLVWNPAGTGGNNWSTSSANTNWLDGAAASSFANGDFVNFTDSGVGTVVIDSAGVLPGAINISNTTGTYTFTGGELGGDGALTKTGAGAVLMQNTSSYTGGTNISEGSLTFASAIPTGPVNITGGTLAVAAKVEANDPSGTSVITSLSITGSTLDLTNNSMVIEYEPGTGPDNTLANEVRQYMQDGRLTTSEPGSRVLGFGDNAVLGRTSFGGVSVSPDSLLVMYTFPGDANLDGMVTIADLSLLATNWQRGVDDGQMAFWYHGDFTHDGRVTIADLSLLAANWQAGVAAGEATMSFAEAMAMFDVFNGIVIPEPSALGLIGLGMLSLRRRRRDLRFQS